MHLHGRTKNTKETCFKLLGYPQWWEDNHKLKEKRGVRSSVVVVVSDEKATNTDGGRYGRRTDKQNNHGEQGNEQTFGGAVARGGSANRKGAANPKGIGFGILHLNPYTLNTELYSVNLLNMSNDASVLIKSFYSVHELCEKKNNQWIFLLWGDRHDDF